MNMKYVKTIFILMTITLLGYVLAGQFFLPADKLDHRNLCYDYTEDWYRVMPDGRRVKLEVPGKNELDGDVMIETTLPDDMDEEISCMCFRAQDFKAYLDGQLIFDYSTEKSRWFGNHSPESCVMVPITAQDGGKTLRIELLSDTGLLYQPYIGSEFGIWMYMVKEYAGELIVAAITFVVAFLTILVSVVYGLLNHSKKDLAWLGLGVVLAAIWLVSNSVFRQIIFVNLSTASDLPFLAIMLIPFPYIIYMNAVQEGRYSALYSVIGMVIAVTNIICCALYVTDTKPLVKTFIFVALGCFLAIAAICATFVVDIRGKRIREYSFVAFGLLGAFSTAAIQLVIYFNRTGVFRGYFLAIGLLILLVGASIHTVRNVFAIEKDKKAAVLANEAKGRFLANMSHEIRTPINAVLGMDEMILRETRELRTREYALDIQNAGKSLLAIINDILDISKIDSGKLEILRTEYDLSSMIHDTMNMIYQKAKSKNLEVGLKLDENLPSRLVGDDVRIRQVLTNILNNAVKYTQTGGATLSVSGERPEGATDRILLHFAVEDTGVGIKEEDMPKLFEEFKRIEESRNRNIEGTGLGMSITVQLLHMMGSGLEVESTYGKGSCFSFVLEQKIADETPVGNLSERIKNQEREYVYETAFTAPDADILVVDDNAVNRKVVRSLLRDTLMRIDETDSGEGCLEKIVHKKYDLIFLDHMMPGMDGIETLKASRTLEGNLNSDTPVVALTANAVTGAREMYLENGFDDFLTKPIVFDKLNRILLHFLPAEKISDGQIQTVEAKPEEETAQIEKILESIEDIDLQYAYLHCTGPVDLYDIMTGFIGLIDSEAGALEKFERELDETGEEGLRQYRVKVHSMKTSAAMIGAVHLSGMARMLEKCAINGEVQQIHAVSPVFIEWWRSYKEKLEPVSAREKSLDDAREKVEFNEDILREQLGLLHDAVEDMDVDRADDIAALLKGFDYPAQYKEIMNAIYAAVTDLDAEKIAELVGKIPL